MKENDQLDENQDFFGEIQEKVERSMFSSEVENAKTFSKDKPRTEKMDPDPEKAWDVDVQVEIVGAESGFADDLDIDDTFLEEIDMIEEEDAGIPAENFAVSFARSQEEGTAHELTVGDFSGVAADLESVQEDDRFMGELIRQEMVDEPSGADARFVDSDRPEAPRPSEESISGAEEKEFSTRTLADLYAQQGHTDKALEIYAKLLQEDPENQEIALRLQEIKSQLASVEEPKKSEGSAPRSKAQGFRRDQILSLEAWLGRIRAEEEKRCLKSC